MTTQTTEQTASDLAKKVANYSPYPYKSIQWEIEWQRAYEQYLKELKPKQ